MVITCLNIKTLGRFDLPGHRATETRTTGLSRGAGYDFAHVAVDCATRLAYVEVLEEERKETTAGFYLRVLHWFRVQSIRAERVMRDNSRAYRSCRFGKALHLLDIRHIFTRVIAPFCGGLVAEFTRLSSVSVRVSARCCANLGARCGRIRASGWQSSSPITAKRLLRRIYSRVCCIVKSPNDRAMGATGSLDE